MMHHEEALSPKFLVRCCMKLYLPVTDLGLRSPDGVPGGTSKGHQKIER